MTKFFEKVKTLEELRKEYHSLAMKFHPDRESGDTKTMQAINAQYEKLTKKLINQHEDYSDDRKEWEMHVSEELMIKIGRIIHLQGINIELIGSWIWITKETFAVKDILKKEGFKFSSNKTAWFFHCGEYQKNNNSLHSMEELRDLFGHQNIESQQQPALT